MPLCLKWANITPLLEPEPCTRCATELTSFRGYWCCKGVIIIIIRRSRLEQGDKKNYHPISKLLFISKLIKEIITSCIEKHLEHDDPNKSYQSAQRKGHSETVLLKVHIHITEAHGEGSLPGLILLDLFAALDVIDHKIVLKHLEFAFWHQGKGHNLSKVVPRIFNSFFFQCWIKHHQM